IEPETLSNADHLTFRVDHRSGPDRDTPAECPHSQSAYPIRGRTRQPQALDPTLIYMAATLCP
ncbi:hypothetical protein JYU34_020778, partial [Plutella xylostella]